MTAKEYLKRIRKLDHDIDRKQYEFETLKKRRTYISGMDYTADRVQTSSDGEGFTGISDRLIDLQREINTEIDEYHDMRHKAINQIQSLSREEYSDILFRLYVQYQSMTEAASGMGYDYYWACHLHGRALLEFDDRFLKHRK